MASHACSHICYVASVWMSIAHACESLHFCRWKFMFNPLLFVAVFTVFLINRQESNVNLMHQSLNCDRTTADVSRAGQRPKAPTIPIIKPLN